MKNRADMIKEVVSDLSFHVKDRLSWIERLANLPFDDDKLKPISFEEVQEQIVTGLAAFSLAPDDPMSSEAWEYLAAGMTRFFNLRLNEALAELMKK